MAEKFMVDIIREYIQEKEPVLVPHFEHIRKWEDDSEFSIGTIVMKIIHHAFEAGRKLENPDAEEGKPLNL
jgi:hypothetical protein